jgi:alginate O-acetyltransferase complex protein AlgJ
LKRFIIKLLIFLTPFVALVAIELFVLPIDFFTFRIWEALKIDYLKNTLPGNFYPSMKITKVEEGDLAFHTPFAIRRKAEWQTDRYGYRNRDTGGPWKIVIIGDSNTIGTGLTQKDMLSEVLGDMLGTTVYAFAPASLNAFFKERRFWEHPPDIVVVATIEREIPLLPRLKRALAFPSPAERRLIDLRCAIKESPILQTLAVPIDRAIKSNILHYSRAALRRTVSAPLSWPSEKQGEIMGLFMRFYVGDKANNDVPRDLLNQAVYTLKSYEKLLTEKGIRFIFLPIPNKENIYWDLLPSRKKPMFIRQITEALDREGIEVMDAQRAFEKVRNESQAFLFQPDDTHWSRVGAQTAARMLAEAILRPGDGHTSRKLLKKGEACSKVNP